MTDTDPIKRAQTLITDLNKAYQACKQASADDVRFQEQLNSILGFLAKAETVDNRVFSWDSALSIQMLLLVPLGGPMTASTLTRSRPS